jgi:tRNA 2-thiouridine synthesizing protein C
MKKILFILSNAPYANTHNLEILEAAMVGAVFDAQVSILFRGESVYSLLREQHGELIGQKSLNKVLGALPAYEVERIFVCAESVANRDLLIDLDVPIQPLNLLQQANLISEQDVVVGAQK